MPGGRFFHSGERPMVKICPLSRMLVMVPLVRFSIRRSPSDFPEQVGPDDAVTVEDCWGNLIETVPAQKNMPKMKKRINRMKPP